MSASSEPIRILIADDEPLARRMMRLMLAQYSDFEVVAEVEHGGQLAAAVRTQRPELLMLDIRMPVCTGMDALANLDAHPLAIFVTAHAEHAVHAFDMDAVDYILKPFDDARLRRALDRGKAAVLMRRSRGQSGGECALSDLTNRTADSGAKIALNDGRRTVFVRADDVVWIESVDYYTQVHTKHRSYLIRHPLHLFERQLAPDEFVRVSRGALVNVKYVHAIERDEGGHVALTLSTDERVPVSRSRRRQVIRILNPSGTSGVIRSQS